MFVSGYFSGSSTMRAVLGEGAHFLQKPFTVSDLAARVREALETP
jgi:DNA-binding response OmpR family regulator